MPRPSDSPPSASGFVIAGFLFTWFMGLYPGLSSVIGSYSPAAAIGLLIALPAIMCLMMFPLWKLQEKEEEEA